MIPGGNHDWHWDFDETGDLGEQMQELKEQLKEQLGDAQRGIIRGAVMQAHEAARRAREDARRAADELRILSRDNGALKASKIDLGKAQIVFSDDKGEMKLENVDGKKLLTVKDPQGKLLFSGPVETKEDLDKLPADVRERYEKLQQNDLPSSRAASTIVDGNDAIRMMTMTTMMTEKILNHYRSNVSFKSVLPSSIVPEFESHFEAEEELRRAP